MVNAALQKSSFLCHRKCHISAVAIRRIEHNFLKNRKFSPYTVLLCSFHVQEIYMTHQEIQLFFQCNPRKVVNSLKLATITPHEAFRSWHAITAHEQILLRLVVVIKHVEPSITTSRLCTLARNVQIATFSAQ